MNAYISSVGKEKHSDKKFLPKFLISAIDYLDDLQDPDVFNMQTDKVCHPVKRTE